MSDENDVYRKWLEAPGPRYAHLEAKLASRVSRHAQAVVWEKLQEHQPELVQDIATATAIMIRLRDFRSDRDCKFSTWVHGIAERKVYEEIRKRRRERMVFDKTIEVVPELHLGPDGESSSHQREVVPTTKAHDNCLRRRLARGNGCAKGEDASWLVTSESQFVVLTGCRRSFSLGATIGIMTITMVTRVAHSRSQQNVKHLRWEGGFLLRRMRNECFTTPASPRHVLVAVIGQLSNGSASAGVPFRMAPTLRSPSRCPIHSGTYLVATPSFAASFQRSLPELSGVTLECATGLKLVRCQLCTPSTGNCCLSRTSTP